jgi:CBS domain-containing protein
MSAQSLHSILTEFKVKDLLEKNSELYKTVAHYIQPPNPISLDGNLSVRDACQILGNNKISSAPISLDGDYIGQLEMSDLVTHVLQVLNDTPISDASDWALGDLLAQTSQTDHPLKSLERHNPLVKVTLDTPLIDVVEEFTRAKAHRVAAFDKNHFVGVISQSTISALVVGKFGLRRPKGASWPTGEKSIKELGLIQEKIVSVSPTATVMEALFIMNSDRISSVAIMQGKHLHGTITLTDVKHILAERNGWRKIFDTCATFFKNIRNSQSMDRKGEAVVPNFTVKPSVTLVSALVSYILC